MGTCVKMQKKFPVKTGPKRQVSYIYKSFATLLLFVYIKPCTLAFDYGSHCYLHLFTKSFFFCKTFFYTQKTKEINPFYVRTIFLSPNTESSLEQ